MACGDKEGGGGSGGARAAAPRATSTALQTARSGGKGADKDAWWLPASFGRIIATAGCGQKRM